MSSGKLYRLYAMTLAAGLLAGCASTAPTALQEELSEAPAQAAVHAQPERYLGREVRWGGEILGVRNERAFTEVEIYGRPLHRDGEPRPEGGAGLRFIARIGRFLDPAEYQAGKRLSVRGLLETPVTRPVGDYPYRYPVVNAQVYHLWPAYEPPHESPWYRYPYYDPWWPWGPWGPYRYWPYGY